MTSVMNTILDYTNQALQRQLQDLVADDDPAKAGLVRIGQLQDDPTINLNLIGSSITVVSMMGDHDDPDKWPNVVWGGPGHEIRFDGPAYEIGGGEMWWRRFTTKLDQFWPDSYEREDARVQALEILSRAEHAIKTSPVLGITDDYGESALQINVVYSRNLEEGGPGQFIWRAKIWWQVATGKV